MYVRSLHFWNRKKNINIRVEPDTDLPDIRYPAGTLEDIRVGINVYDKFEILFL